METTPVVPTAGVAEVTATTSTRGFSLFGLGTQASYSLVAGGVGLTLMGVLVVIALINMGDREPEPASQDTTTSVATSSEEGVSSSTETSVATASTTSSAQTTAAPQDRTYTAEGTVSQFFTTTGRSENLRFTFTGINGLQVTNLLDEVDTINSYRVGITGSANMNIFVIAEAGPWSEEMDGFVNLGSNNLSSADLYRVESSTDTHAYTTDIEGATSDVPAASISIRMYCLPNSDLALCDQIAKSLRIVKL